MMRSTQTGMLQLSGVATSSFDLTLKTLHEATTSFPGHSMLGFLNRVLESLNRKPYQTFSKVRKRIFQPFSQIIKRSSIALTPIVVSGNTSPKDAVQGFIKSHVICIWNTL